MRAAAAGAHRVGARAARPRALLAPPGDPVGGLALPPLARGVSGKGITEERRRLLLHLSLQRQPPSTAEVDVATVPVVEMVVTGYDPKAIVVTPLDDSVDLCRPLPVGWACKVGANRALQMTELPFFVEATPKGRRDRELARAASLTLWTQLCAGQPYFNRGEPQPGNGGRAVVRRSGGAIGAAARAARRPR